MADSLGEKLRLAREARDITISEVAEQTRISALYLQAIENDDYRTLPGGIFNKGFVKSFAKYVGVDEQEALDDYSKIVAKEEAEADENDPRNYRPQVLTDNAGRGSMLPTIIIAMIILGLMAWGILTLVKYVRSVENGVSGKENPANSNVVPRKSPATSPNTNQEPIPATDSIRIKISTSAEQLSIESTADGKLESFLLNSGQPARVIEAKESVSLNYYKGEAATVTLELNGKKIAAPLPPENYRKTGLKYEINMDNIKRILQEGKIDLAGSQPPAPNTNSAISAPQSVNNGNAQ